MGAVFVRHFAFALIALVVAICVFPTSAQAQVAPCPFGGPSPGYRVVGQTPSGGPVGSVLLCEPVYENQPQQQQQQEEYRRPPPPPPTPKTYTDAYYSVVVHPDARKVWASARRFTLEEARKDSLAYCTKMMGNGCRIAVSGANNSVYVYKLPDGNLIIPNDGEWSVEKGKILKNCQQLIRCARADLINSNIIATEVGAPINDVSYYVIPENNADLYNLYGAIAWTGPGTPMAKKIWTSGGHKTRKAAEDTALALCTKAQKSADIMCRSAISGGNSFLIVWADQQKNIQFVSDFAPAENITPKLNWEYFSNICKTKKPKCTLKHIVDVRQPGAFEKTIP